MYVLPSWCEGLSDYIVLWVLSVSTLRHSVLVSISAVRSTLGQRTTRSWNGHSSMLLRNTVRRWSRLPTPHPAQPSLCSFPFLHATWANFEPFFSVATVLCCVCCWSTTTRLRWSTRCRDNCRRVDTDRSFGHLPAGSLSLYTCDLSSVQTFSSRHFHYCLPVCACVRVCLCVIVVAVLRIRWDLSISPVMNVKYCWLWLRQMRQFFSCSRNIYQDSVNIDVVPGGCLATREWRKVWRMKN